MDTTVETKSFDLCVLVSFLNQCLELDVTEEQKDELLQHIHGRSHIGEREYTARYNEACKHLREKCPRAFEASQLVAHAHLDQDRYIRMINLFGLKHEVPAYSR